MIITIINRRGIMSAKYSIGIDYGTLSGRAVLVDVSTGAEICEAVSEYKHKVMSDCLPSGVKLPADYALQHPMDYVDVLATTIREIFDKTKIQAQDIIGVGVDFTACTLVPIDNNGQPMCFNPKYVDNPHSYVKLWKHHSAQKCANILNDLAHNRGEKWIDRYGGKISSEWVFPKIMEIAEEDPTMYKNTYKYIEATDWIVMLLTGGEYRNSCTAGYKAMWHKREGYPSNDFFKSLHPLLDNVVNDKLSNNIYSIGTKAGCITREASMLTGLCEGTAVAIGNVDAHVAVASLGMVKPGEMLMVMGTSTCHMLLGDSEKSVQGICGVVEDGIMPNLYGYEAGQSCVGDHFQWLVDNCVPEEYFKNAADKGISVHKYIEDIASKLKVGESGLIALDWWNGNRSILVDIDLSGMLLGMNLSTKVEEIYRALIEALAFGTKTIIENYRQAGVNVNGLYAAGGIAKKSSLMMQIFADVCDMEIKISGSKQAPAHGSAIFGAVAAGSSAGGYDDIETAARNMGKVMDVYYKPITENVAQYNELYKEYITLHDYFARENNVMKRLKKMREKAINQNLGKKV